MQQERRIPPSSFRLPDPRTCASNSVRIPQLPDETLETNPAPANTSQYSDEDERRVIEAVLCGFDKLFFDRLRRQLHICGNRAEVWHDAEDTFRLLAFEIVIGGILWRCVLLLRHYSAWRIGNRSAVRLLICILRKSCCCHQYNENGQDKDRFSAQLESPCALPRCGFADRQLD